MLLEGDTFRSLLAGCSRATKRMAKCYAAAFVRHSCVGTQGHWLGDVCCGAEELLALKEQALRATATPYL